MQSNFLAILVFLLSSWNSNGKTNGGVCLNSVVLSRAVVDPGLQEEVPTPRVGALTCYFANIFVENYVKMEEFGPERGGTNADVFLVKIRVFFHLTILFSVKYLLNLSKSFPITFIIDLRERQNKFSLCSYTNGKYSSVQANAAQVLGH